MTADFRHHGKLAATLCAEMRNVCCNVPCLYLRPRILADLAHGATMVWDRGPRGCVCEMRGEGTHEDGCPFERLTGEVIGTLLALVDLCGPDTSDPTATRLLVLHLSAPAGVVLGDPDGDGAELPARVLGCHLCEDDPEGCGMCLIAAGASPFCPGPVEPCATLSILGDVAAGTWSSVERVGRMAEAWLCDRAATEDHESDRPLAACGCDLAADLEECERCLCAGCCPCHRSDLTARAYAFANAPEVSPEVSDDLWSSTMLERLARLRAMGPLAPPPWGPRAAECPPAPAHVPARAIAEALRAAAVSDVARHNAAVEREASLSTLAIVVRQAGEAEDACPAPALEAPPVGCAHCSGECTARSHWGTLDPLNARTAPPAPAQPPRIPRDPAHPSSGRSPHVTSGEAHPLLDGRAVLAFDERVTGADVRDRPERTVRRAAAMVGRRGAHLRSRSELNFRPLNRGGMEEEMNREDGTFGQLHGGAVGHCAEGGNRGTQASEPVVPGTWAGLRNLVGRACDQRAATDDREAFRIPSMLTFHYLLIWAGWWARRYTCSDAQGWVGALVGAMLFWTRDGGPDLGPIEAVRQACMGELVTVEREYAAPREGRDAPDFCAQAEAWHAAAVGMIELTHALDALVRNAQIEAVERWRAARVAMLECAVWCELRDRLAGENREADPDEVSDLVDLVHEAGAEAWADTRGAVNDIAGRPRVMLFAATSVITREELRRLETFAAAFSAGPTAAPGGIGRGVGR